MWNISYEKPTNPRFKDMTGQIFGRLRVVSFDYIKRKYGQGRAYWKCICECGNEVSVISGSLVSGDTVSCGCYRKEKVLLAPIKHNLSKHPVYKRVISEISRCHDPNNKDYKNYGGREITVYQPWLDDLGLMIRDIERLIGLPPTAKHHLDRPDNDRGYEPTNICWKTPKENQRNKRINHHQSVHPITGKTTSTYNSWKRLIQLHYYEVCIEWRSDGNPDTDNGFKNFYRDMGDKPRKRSPIKRYDESKPFSKSNCYWG